MQSYFFIPGSRLHKLKYIKSLNVDEIIIDLEDAVKLSERNAALSHLISEEIFMNYYIRIPLYDSNYQIDTVFLNLLIRHGFRKFIFPKVQSNEDFELIFSQLENKDLQIILLIETPRFFLEIKEILIKYSKNIQGLAIGSHDLIAIIGGVHNLKNLEYLRLQILYLARMINVKAIDIASMELHSEENLQNEILDGFEKGYDAKFYIHPWQIQIKNKLNLYTEKDWDWAKKIMEVLKSVGSSDEFNPTIIEGQIIERPHLNKAQKIIKYYENK